MATNKNMSRLEWHAPQTFLGYKAAQKRTVEKTESTGPVDASLAGLSTIEILRLRAEQSRAEKAERVAREDAGRVSTIDRLRAARVGR